jgi:DNA primase
LSRFALTEEFEKLLGQPIPERSQNAMVRCPFHMDDRPSMSVDLDRGLWVCFGCGEKGSIFSLAHRLEQEIDETDVILRAYEAAAAAPYYEEPPNFADLADLHHRQAWSTQAPEVVRYLVHKGLSGQVFRHFKLGWNGKAIAMPYYDDDRVVAIKYRYPDGSKGAEKGSKRFIYNVNEVRSKPVVVMCEGESDTHAVWSALDRSNPFWQNVAVGGVPGVSITKATWELWALELMWAKRVFICFDADDPGDRGADTAMSILGSKAVRLRPTKGKDMNEHLLRGGTLHELGLDEEDVQLQLAG